MIVTADSAAWAAIRCAWSASGSRTLMFSSVVPVGVETWILSSSWATLRCRSRSSTTSSARVSPLAMSTYDVTRCRASKAAE